MGKKDVSYPWPENVPVAVLVGEVVYNEALVSYVAVWPSGPVLSAWRWYPVGYQSEQATWIINLLQHRQFGMS